MNSGQQRDCTVDAGSVSEWQCLLRRSRTLTTPLIAPHLQRLLEMMKREQQDAARTAEQAAASDAASEADPNPTEASAAPAAPIPTYIPASTAGAGHYHGPPVGLSPSARTSGTSPLSHSSGVSGGVRAPSTEEFTRRLFREIAAQHEQQVCRVSVCPAQH